MKSSSYLILATFLLIVAVAAYLMYPPDSVGTAPSVDIDQYETPVENEATPQIEEKLTKQSAPVLSAEPEEPIERDCSGLVQLEDSHPMVMDESERLAPLLVAGPSADAYRDLSQNDIARMAAAGDSMAMAMLGAKEYLSAFGSDADPADWLERPGGLGVGQRAAGSPALTPQQVDALDRSAHWLYEAAVNGRLFALVNYANVLESRFGGARELDWIEDDDLPEGQSPPYELIPSVVYAVTLFELEPQLKEGVFGLAFEEGMKSMLARSDRRLLDRVVDEQVRLFQQARDDIAADAPALPPSRYTEEEIRAEFCQR